MFRKMAWGVFALVFGPQIVRTVVARILVWGFFAIDIYLRMKAGYTWEHAMQDRRRYRRDLRRQLQEIVIRYMREHVQDYRHLGLIKHGGDVQKFMSKIENAYREQLKEDSINGY